MVTVLAGLGIYFRRWLVIIVNAKTYLLNPGDLFNIPMRMGKNGYFLTGVQRINWFSLYYHLHQHHIPRVGVEEVDGATLLEKNTSSHNEVYHWESSLG